MLQAALLEAAVEAAAKGDGSDDKRSTFVETYCPECENLMLTNASFCIVCGTSVRSSSRQARSAMGISAVPVGAPTVDFDDPVDPVHPVAPAYPADPADPAAPDTDGGAK
jgi:hypothetical protein